MLRHAALALALCAGAAEAQLSPAPTLAADTLFPVPGAPFTLTLSGPAGGSGLFLAALAPGEAPLGAKGTLFLDAASFFPFFSGTLPAGGSLSLPLALPPMPGLTDVFFYVQGAVKLAGKTGLSNALPFRIAEAPPAGARHPLAVAATPDGTRAFVVHEEDGSLSVIDAVHDVKLLDLPVGEEPGDVAVDPEGRHVFVVNAGSPFLSVLDAASSSVVAQLPVPLGCQLVAFDFAAATPRLYVTNLRDDVVLVFEETAPGHFTALPPLELEGSGPVALAVLPGGRLMLGDRGTHELEVLDPALPAGSQTVARTPLGAVPHDVLVSGTIALVPTFDWSATTPRNRLLKISLTTFQKAGTALNDVGTDYVDLAPAGPWLAVVAAGSGTLVIATASTQALAQHLDLAPGAGPGPGGKMPNANPQRAVLVAPGKLYVVDYFRETLRPVLLGAAPPFALGPEIALSHSGQPLVPLQDLSQEDDGEWWFRSVQFLKGTPLAPNNLTCATCHPGGGSDGLNHNRQVPAMFRLGETAPYGWAGVQPSLIDQVHAVFGAHSQTGGPMEPGSDLDVQAYLVAHEPPRSPFLVNGAPSAQALAGKALFEGAAHCADCHAGPVFIPLPPTPLTFAGGIGTGLVPINVPSLRGAWSTPPYLHDGSRPTLMDVLTDNPGDQHGLTSTLTSQQRAELVEYLRTL
jgi:YVTN family beta-propeller protein